MEYRLPEEAPRQSVTEAMGLWGQTGQVCALV